VWHPVVLASPDHAAPGGSIPAHRRPGLPGLPPGSRVVALGEVGGMPHLAHPPSRSLAPVSAIPESCPPGEGMFCVDRAALADVAPLRQRWPELYWPEWLFTCEDIG
jgi:hypothetical protein